MKTMKTMKAIGTIISFHLNHKNERAIHTQTHESKREREEESEMQKQSILVGNFSMQLNRMHQFLIERRRMFKRLQIMPKKKH